MLVSDAESCDDPGTEALYDDVRLLRKSQKRIAAPLISDVELRELVAAPSGVREIRWLGPGGAASGNRSDLHDLRAEVGKKPCTARGGTDTRQVENGDAN